MSKQPTLFVQSTRLLFLLWAAAILVPGCRDPFDPEIEGFDSLLVVEGRITTDSAGSQVLLSRSYGFDGDTLLPVSGARVWFEEEGGDVHQLSETAPGEYLSNYQQFQPTIGNSYRLRLITADAREYVSEYVELITTPEIESLTPTYSFFTNPDGSERVGVEFLLNTRDPEGKTKYYGWTYQESWEFYVPFFKRAYWEWEPEPRVRLIPQDEIVDRCWRFDESTQILVGTSQQLEEDRIVDLPIHFVGINSERVHWGYSLLVKQFSLTEPEYSFLENIKQNTEATGSIFDPVPAELSGNIRNVNEPSEPVIGYFSASEITEKRVFINRDFFPDSIRTSRPLAGCKQDTIFFNAAGTPEESLELLRFQTESLSNTYLDTAFISISPVGWKYTDDICADCKLTGSPEKPAYWPN